MFPDGSFLGGGLLIGRQRAGPGNALPDAHGGRQREPDRDPLRAGGRGGDVRFQRITRIDDARWTTGSNGTYPFTYNGDAIPHLTAIANDIHTAEKFTFTNASNAPLHDPFDNGAQPATTLLQSVQVTGLSGSKHQFEYSTGAGEMAKATMPLGGELAWTYGTFVYSGPRQYREAQTRPMRPSTGGALYTWNITHDSNTAQHYWTTVADTGAEIFGCVGVVWAAAFYFWYRDNPLQKPKMNGAERELLRQSSKMASGHGDVPWGRMVRSRQLWMLCWQFFALNYGWYFNVTWLPTYLREARHLAIASTALLSMLPLFMGGLGNPVSVFLTARLTRKLNDVGRARRMVARLGFVGAGGFLFFSTRMPGPLAAMLAIGMASFCNDFVMPVAWSSAADIGGEHAGTLSGAMNMWGNLGGALSPIAIGYMLDATHNNWNLTFYVSAAVYLTGAVFWSFLDPVTPLGRQTGR